MREDGVGEEDVVRYLIVFDPYFDPNAVRIGTMRSCVRHCVALLYSCPQKLPARVSVNLTPLSLETANPSRIPLLSLFFFHPCSPPVPILV